jgi:hypothetical protein
MKKRQKTICSAKRKEKDSIGRFSNGGKKILGFWPAEQHPRTTNGCDLLWTNV